VALLRDGLPWPAVRFLRRGAGQSSTQPAGDEPAKDEPDTPGGATPGTGKGRPTPKRREAEARRRGPVAPPPRTQREAMKRLRGSKEDRRAERAERRQRMMSGDERFLLPRDRGPARAYVRDLVDSRRQLMGLFMPMALIVLLTLFIPDQRIQSAVSLATMGLLAVIVIETVFLGRQISQRVRQKFPNAKDSSVSLTFYAFTRATMLRRLRNPRPRVNYGDVVD